MTKIAVLGAGNGGCACAVDLTLNSFDVTLCSAYRPSHIKPLLQKGGIEYSGELGEGFVKLKVTTSLKEAAVDADIIIIVTPSSVHEHYARLLVSVLNKRGNEDRSREKGEETRKKQMILLNGSTTGGALFVSRILKEMGISGPLVCETDILNYACRLALGGLAIATGIAVLVFPVFTTGILVTLLSVGLLFVGIARIIHGITAKNTSKWSRVFALGVGILSVAIAAMVISTPLLGVFLLTFILAINLLIIGIENITYALAGRGFKTNATAYMKNSK